MVDVDDSCQFSADSQPKSIGLVWGLAATQRSVYSASEVTTLWRYTNLFIIIIFLKPTSTMPQAEKLGQTYKIMVATAIIIITFIR